MLPQTRNSLKSCAGVVPAHQLQPSAALLIIPILAPAPQGMHTVCCSNSSILKLPATYP
jgi:hypothetical protein